MKHKKTIGGLFILVSLALAGCNGSSSLPSDDSTPSDITSGDTTSIIDES